MANASGDSNAAIMRAVAARVAGKYLSAVVTAQKSPPADGETVVDAQSRKPIIAAQTPNDTKAVTVMATNGSTLPSLRGTPDQLAEAKRLLQSATKGTFGTNSRGRVLSKDPESANVPSRTTSISSCHTSRTSATGSEGASLARSGHTVMKARPNLTSDATPASPQRAPVPSPDPKIQAWNTFAASKTAVKQVFNENIPRPKRADSVQSMKPDVPKVDETSAAGTPISKGVHPLQPASVVTNVLGPSSARNLPPHPRRDAASHLPALTALSVAAMARTSSPDTQIAGRHEKPAENASATVPVSNDTTSNAEKAYGSNLVTKEAGMMYPRNLEVALRDITQRMAILETDNLVLQQQLEALMQVEERRKFMGTDDAKTPFGVNVESRPNDTIYRVQASAELKICDFIRRVRTKANMSSAATPNPRISFKGQQIGHGMTMGEAKIAKNDTLVFSYDPPSNQGIRWSLLGSPRGNRSEEKHRHG